MRKISKKLFERLKRCAYFLFDFDGTLLNSEKYHMKAHSFVLSKILNKKYKMKYEVFNKYVGNIDDFIFDQYKKDFNVEFDKQKMIEMKVETSKKLLESKRVKIFKYFYQLRKLFPDTKFYIVSNQEKGFLENILKNKNIFNEFEDIFSVPELGIKKEEFLSNIEKFIGIKPWQCAIFEDVDKYLKHAKTLGMLTIGIESERNKNTLISADFVIKS